MARLALDPTIFLFFFVSFFLFFFLSLSLSLSLHTHTDTHTHTHTGTPTHIYTHTHTHIQSAPPHQQHRAISLPQPTSNKRTKYACICAKVGFWNSLDVACSRESE